MVVTGFDVSDLDHDGTLSQAELEDLGNLLALLDVQSRTERRMIVVAPAVEDEEIREHVTTLRTKLKLKLKSREASRFIPILWVPFQPSLRPCRPPFVRPLLNVA